jgi:hypothetical protein
MLPRWRPVQALRTWPANASALTTAAGANEALQLRQQAEPIFQAWRKAQPGWFSTTNGGSFPLYNSPSDQDLVPEPVDSVR